MYASAKKKKKNIFLIRLVLFFLLFLSAFVFLKLQTKFWQDGDKLSLVVQKTDGGVEIATFDSSSQSITKIEIPGDTQVEVSRGLGEWRLKSLWQLSINEKAGGSLLSETIAKNFNFPTYTWANENALGFTDNNQGSILKAVFSSYKTNLGLGDKIAITLFSLGVKNTARESVDLATTTYLKKTRLKDGEMGYVITQNFPENISAIFADPTIGSKDFRVEIIDSGGGSAVKEVAQVVQVLGPKVTSIIKDTPSQMDCEVSGSESKFIEKVSKIFNCKIVKIDTGNFDMVVKIGEKFSQRF